MITKSNKYKRTRIKFSVFSLVIYLIGILIFTYWNYQNDKKILMNEIDNKLFSVATNINYILPEKIIENNYNSSYLSKYEDWNNIKLLTKFAKTSNVDLLFVLAKKESKFYYISSSTNYELLNSNNVISHWTAYKTPSENLQKSFYYNTITYETKINSFGEYRTIYIPYKNTEGQLLILGADYNYKRINKKIYSRTLDSILKGFFFIILAFPLFFSVYYLQRKNSKFLEKRIKERMQELTDEINERKIIEEELKKSYNQLEELAIKANAASQAKSSFLATMSHEIRTPMNGIIGMINILKQSDLSLEQKDSLNIIDFSANNLLAIVNDILDFSKIESGQIELESIPFNLHKSIEDIIKLLSFKTTDKNIALKREIDDDIPEYVIGDPVRINQIILNLTNNAIKFTEKGSVKIKLEKIDSTESEIIIKISIIDTGIGISDEAKANLFNEFFQANNTISRKYGGTGLGLAISKRLAELMKGKIGVESSLGIGSTFWFTISLLNCTKEEYLQSKHQQPIIKKMEHKLEILVAEDNLINQKIVMANLKKMGHKVDVASNGQIAIELFKQKNYDIILMDVQMPELNGIEATQAIRLIEEKEGKKPIYIVAMTANVLKEDIEHYLKIGMNSYLSKPFKVEELVNILDKI